MAAVEVAVGRPLSLRRRRSEGPLRALDHLPKVSWSLGVDWTALFVRALVSTGCVPDIKC